MTELSRALAWYQVSVTLLMRWPNWNRIRSCNIYWNKTTFTHPLDMCSCCKPLCITIVNLFVHPNYQWRTVLLQLYNLPQLPPLPLQHQPTNLQYRYSPYSSSSETLKDTFLHLQLVLFSALPYQLIFPSTPYHVIWNTTYLKPKKPKFTFVSPPTRADPHFQIVLWNTLQLDFSCSLLQKHA